jgi:hypothetical protein
LNKGNFYNNVVNSIDRLITSAAAIRGVEFSIGGGMIGHIYTNCKFISLAYCAYSFIAGNTTLYFDDSDKFFTISGCEFWILKRNNAATGVCFDNGDFSNGGGRGLYGLTLKNCNFIGISTINIKTNLINCKHSDSPYGSPYYLTGTDGKI